MYLLLFPGPSSPDFQILCRGTVPGRIFVSCTSKAQTVHLSGCSMTVQFQLSHASPALPRPKWPGVLSEHSPRWALCLMHFPGPSCSCSRMFQSTLFQRATQALRIAVKSQSQMGHVFRALLRFILVSFSDTPQAYSPCIVSCASQQRSCSLVMTLFAGINCPRSQEAIVRGCSWMESAHSLAGDAVSWA